LTTDSNLNDVTVKKYTGMNIFQRMNAAQQEITYVQKEKKQGMKYSVVSHDDVTAKVRPVLVDWGVFYYPCNLLTCQVGNRTQVDMQVRFVNIDDPQDTFIVASLGHGIDEQDKGPGKAISYGVKYALLKAMGMETGDDPDLDQDVQHKPGKHDPVGIAIADFTNETALATTEDGLREIADRFKEDMAHAAGTYPAEVQAAKQKWQAKMAQVKKAKPVQSEKSDRD
jgi:hypothetical protein